MYLNTSGDYREMEHKGLTLTLDVFKSIRPVKFLAGFMININIRCI